VCDGVAYLCVLGSVPGCREGMHSTDDHGLAEDCALIALREEVGCGCNMEINLLVFRQHGVGSIERGEGLRGEGGVHRY
jgi:hypothetical protein